MDATLSPPSARRRRTLAVRPWTLVVLALLLAAGTLFQACSDNNGTTGPKFECREQKGGVSVLAQCTGSPAPVTGDATGGPLGDLVVTVTLNPSTIDRGRRASVLVIVTNAHGIGVANRNIQLTSLGGSLDQTQGVSGSNGLFSTTMVVPCGGTATAGTVTAIVDGKISSGLTGAFTIVDAVENNPCS